MLRGNDNAEKIWNKLLDVGANAYGAAGTLGNLDPESGLNPQNLQDTGNRKLGMTDQEYTSAVDARTYLNFCRDGIGYGVAQWTYWSRKQALLNFARKTGKSIGDLEMQLDFYIKEMQKNYLAVWNILKTARSVEEASRAVMLKYEAPGDQSEANINRRATIGLKYYRRFAENGGNSMAIRIAHASISEKGTVNGAKGDQTKKEVCVRTWYSKPWDFMAIHPDAIVREKHAKTAEAGCANDNIGYGQGDRNTLNTEAKKVGYDLSKITVPCNTDCSEFQNVCAVASGSGATHASNGWTTRTMRNALKALGYVIVTDATYLANEAYCVRGAIYVQSGSHTVCGLDNGSKAEMTLKRAGIVTGTQKPSASVPTSAKVLIRKLAGAQSKDKKLAGEYHTTTGLNLRYGPDKEKYDTILTMPKGAKCRCYGYYTEKAGKKWLLVEYTENKKTYTGFCSSAYLTR